jgi:hypothetical protein
MIPGFLGLVFCCVLVGAACYIARGIVKNNLS